MFNPTQKGTASPSELVRRTVQSTIIAINDGPNICCARCTKVVKTGQQRFKVGRYTYGFCCITKVVPGALEEICS